MSEEPKQPSFADLTAALKVLQQPAESDSVGFSKHFTTFAVAAAIGLGAWLMNGLNTMQMTVTQVATTVAAMQRSLDQLSTDRDSEGQRRAMTETIVARLDQRMTANEQRIDALERAGKQQHVQP